MTNTVGQVQTDPDTPHPALSMQDLSQRSLGHGYFEEVQKGQAGMEDSTGEGCWSNILGCLTHTNTMQPNSSLDLPVLPQLAPPNSPSLQSALQPSPC